MENASNPNEVAKAVSAEDRDTTIVQIEVTPAEGGALLRMGGPGVPTKSRVVEGDPTSDSFRRKVQRTIVGWTKKVYFTAPPRAKKAETASA